MINRRFIILLVCCLLFVVALAGCAEPVGYPEVVSPQPQLMPAPTLILPEYRIVGSSVRKQPLLCTIIGRGQDVTFILATIHGDEPAGTPLVRQLAKYLQKNTQLLTGRKVVLLPVANPDGMAYNSRFNANGVDLNRNFATNNRINNKEFGYNALSEPEACAIEQLIRQYSPDRIISIHQPMACIDYDGPAYSLANRMAQHCDLPVKKIGAKPGSLGSYAGLTLGIPIVTFEMTQGDSSLSTEALWQKYGDALLAAITSPQTLAAK
jgi:protein MpaA